MIEKKKNSYAVRNFEVNALGSSAVLSNNPDPLARLVNSLTRCFQKFNTLPKIIVVVPENDVMKALKIKDDNFGTSIYYEETISWIVEQMKATTAEFKKQLAPKSSKNRLNWPFMLWMAPSLHDHYDELDHKNRKKFTKALENVANESNKISSLRMRYVWDAHDPTLFTENDKRFTAQGWHAIWGSIDKSIEYFDQKMIPNIEQEREASKFKFRREGRITTNNNFDQPRTSKDLRGEIDEKTYNRNWQRIRRHHGQPGGRKFYKKLPTPPPKDTEEEDYF